MEKWIKENCKIILAVLGFIVGGPLVINWLFKLHLPTNFWTVEWDASAVLSYYGTILASVIAIYGIFITIQYSQKSYKDDIRDRSLPFIVIDMLKTSGYGAETQLGSLQNELESLQGYREYKLVNYYCILTKGKIEYRTSLTESQQEFRDNGGRKIVPFKDVKNFYTIYGICVPIEIENIGNGTAIRLRYGINRKEINEKERRYLPTLSLKPSAPMMLHIFSEDCSRESLNLGEYVLSFFYEDIYSNRYEQHFDITIEYNQEKQYPVFSMDMGHIQNFLGGK